jgi:hypothetical protein
MFDLTGGKCDPATTLVSIVYITVCSYPIDLRGVVGDPGNTGDIGGNCGHPGSAPESAVECPVGRCCERVLLVTGGGTAVSSVVASVAWEK